MSNLDTLNQSDLNLDSYQIYRSTDEANITLERDRGLLSKIIRAIRGSGQKEERSMCNILLRTHNFSGNNKERI